MWKWLFGVPGVDGISTDIPSAPELMLSLVRNQVEQGKKIDKIWGVLDELRIVAHKTNEVATATNEQIMPNGENTNNIGDILIRKARREGDYLENLDDVAYTRRKSDKKSK